MLTACNCKFDATRKYFKFIKMKYTYYNANEENGKGLMLKPSRIQI